MKNKCINLLKIRKRVKTIIEHDRRRVAVNLQALSEGLTQAIAQFRAKILISQTHHQNFPRADNIMYD
ncbi:hypothetical protein [Nostoc sp.]|uniref:hypothetical protein n=1 Tax=Nostoc sp. TaxID=1180 RepID=UPI002FFCCF4D